MKVLPFTIPKPENVTLYTEHYKGENFYEKLHQHKEIQISLVIAGEGTFVIGDCVGDFKQNDIFVLGENLPHVFKRDEAFEQETEMVSLFFSKNSFGEDFFNLPEFTYFKKFFDNAVLGYKVQSYKQEISLILSKIKSIFHGSKLSVFAIWREHSIPLPRTQDVNSCGSRQGAKGAKPACLGAWVVGPDLSGSCLCRAAMAEQLD